MDEQMCEFKKETRSFLFVFCFWLFLRCCFSVEVEDWSDRLATGKGPTPLLRPLVYLDFSLYTEMTRDELLETIFFPG